MPTPTMPARPVTVLLSRKAEEQFGTQIAGVLATAGHRFIHPERDLAIDAESGVDIGFLTRDVTGTSSKLKLSEAMASFFATLDRSPGLNWVHTHSAGADRPMYPVLLARGVKVTTSSGANALSVALSAVGGVIALARKFPDLMSAQRRHAWEPLLGPLAPRDLAGQSALVVGLGPIGREISRLLRAIGLRVTGVRRRPEPIAECDETIGFDDVRGRLPGTDWLILACPLTPTTRGLIDAGALALLPPGARVVNVSRGEVVSEAALTAALQSGALGGAWLDVFEREPLDPASPLWDLSSVMISPHTAAAASGNYERAGRIFLDNLARWRDGRAMMNQVEHAETR